MTAKRSKQRLDTRNEVPEVAAEVGKRKFSKASLVNFKPLTPNQKLLVDAILDEDITVVSALGAAGSGKTFVALYMALLDVFDSSSPRDKVIIIRSAVESRSIGFLKGSQEEKEAVYELPYKPLLSQMLKSERGTPVKDAYDHLKAQGVIEFCTTSFLRGLTFDNAVIVFDEVQNSDLLELETVIERSGLNAKVILAGDTKQNDLKRKREISGLEAVINILERMPEHYRGVNFTFNDCVRSPFVRAWLMAKDAVV